MTRNRHISVGLYSLFSISRRAFRILFLHVPIFAAIPIFCSVAIGQSIIIRLVNGHSGKPVAKVHVYIGFDDLRGQPLDLTTNIRGEVQFEVHGATTFQVHPVGVVSCGEQPVGAPYVNYSIRDTLNHGVLTKNDCGHLNAPPVRGDLLYFVRRATWWELFKN